MRFYNTGWTITKVHDCQHPGCHESVYDLRPDDPDNRDQANIHGHELTPLD